MILQKKVPKSGLWKTDSHILGFMYSHLSNNRGGWNKPVGVQKLKNQLDFFHQFLC